MANRTGKSALKIVQKYHPSVTKVLEGRRDLSIHVTAKDCAGATKKAPSSCALAKAASRKYDGAIVSLNVAYLIKGRTATRYKVPAAISRELVSFDRHGDFRPGEYFLKAPRKTETLGALRKYAKDQNLRRKPGYKQKRDHKPRIHYTEGLRAL